MLKRRAGIGPAEMFAVVQLPQVLPRFVPVEQDSTTEFILLEDVVGARLSELFGGYDIVEYGSFRITRDMDVELLEQEGDDMLRADRGPASAPASEAKRSGWRFPAV